MMYVYIYILAHPSPGVIVIVRTYVDHVENICHLELDNPLKNALYL